MIRSKRTLPFPSRKTVAEVVVSALLILFIAGGSAVVGAREAVRTVQERSAFLWAAGEGQELAAVVVMQPQDCASMAPILDRLSSLLAMSEVSVRGLLATNRTDDALADSLIAEKAVSFGLGKAPFADLAVPLRAVGIDATPVVVLVDDQGRVRYIAPLAPYQSAVDAETRRILAVVSEMRDVQ